MGLLHNNLWHINCVLSLLMLEVLDLEANLKQYHSINDFILFLKDIRIKRPI